MRVWSDPFVIFLIFTSIFKPSCQDKGSLTYVIDNTSSMRNDIRQVKESADGITKIVFEEKGSQIENMVLVTFNDPYARVEINTRNRDDFKRSVNKIIAHNPYGNRDCAEPSMNGLAMGLQNSLPGSYIYVFTDASAKDHLRSREIMNLCQQKQTQITFVLTGYCYGLKETGFRVYYDIATACSGLAFFVTKDEVDKVLEPIKDIIRGNKTVISTVKAPPNRYTDVPFVIDDQTEYAIVTASGSKVELSVKGPGATQERTMWLKNAKVIKLTDPTPGTYIATVKGHTETSVYIMGKTDFLFSHGFSELEPKSIKDTTPQPIADRRTHLSIAVTDRKHTVNINSAQILDMNEKVIMTLPLRRIANDFYTTAPFVAPSQRFKVAVIGKAVRTGKDIRRIAKIPVTPQDPPRPTSKKPVVTISEGSSTAIDYGKTFKLTCKVSAYPMPIITWKNGRGTTLTSQSSTVLLPYDHISYLTITDALASDTYSCQAGNNLGSDAKNIKVTVKEPFDVKSTITGKTVIQYGTKNILTCDIRASVPIHIHWILENDMISARKQLVTSDKYEISADGKQLTIKNMDLDMIGKYTCKATLDRDPNKFVSFSTKVEISGLAIPAVKGDSVKTVTKGSNTNINCHVTGVPKPTITWQFKAKDASTFVSQSGSDNVLQISNVDVKHAGQYKCVAHNVVGDAEHVTTLNVLVPPVILPSSSAIYKAIEDKDALLKIPCVATGLPKPVITWNVNGVLVSQNTKYSIENGALIIRNPKVSDSATYTCQAANDAGTVHTTFQAVIHQAPKLTGDTEKIVRINEAVQIECKVLKGVPVPTIVWQFMAKDASTFVSIPGSDKVLRMSRVDKTSTGRYKCIASNAVGTAEHVTSLTVQYPPNITSKQTTYKGLEGDIALRIPCDTVGVPKPAVSWRAGGVAIVPNARYLINNGALIIKDPKAADSKSYTCKAQNSLGAAEATFKAEVDAELDDYGTVKEINILEGSTKKLECGSDDPNQSVRWFTEGNDWKINKKHIILEHVTFNDDGNYTCRVSDMNGGYTVTYEVVVGHPPVFTFEQESTDFDWKGSENEFDMLDCQVDAKPLPDVVWTYNGKVLSGQESQFLAVSGNWGRYTCNVSNVHGAVQKTFDVRSSKCFIKRKPQNDLTMPLILSPEATWPVLESTNDYLKVESGDKLIFSCPNRNGANNFLAKFNTVNEVTASCDKQDMFIVNGKSYKTTDLHCANTIVSTVVDKHVKCLTDTSTTMRVGYNVHGFLETYEVCYDVSKDIPLYTRVLMSKSNSGPQVSYRWHSYFDILGGKSKAGKSNGGYTCGPTKSSCCYSKAQLVNARDFSDGPAQKSSYLEPLNTVPYWRPCGETKDTWSNIESMIRSQFSTYPQFVAWSGTHMLQNQNGQIIPRYLWKVLRFDDDDSLAIVYINDPSPSNEDILCKNKCVDDNVPWLRNLDKHSYCCDVNEFLEAFGLKSTSVGESMDKALQKIRAKK